MNRNALVHNEPSFIKTHLALHSLQQVESYSLNFSSFWSSDCKKSFWPSLPNDTVELRVADLFSGCGGLSLGTFLACNQLGLRLKIALAADNWFDALAIYKTNFAPFLSNTFSEDLGNLVECPGSLSLSPLGRKLARQTGKVDLVIAGPPCQGHSDLNNASRRNDPRNFLYAIPVAFALETKATYVFIENVPTVIHAAEKLVSLAQRRLVEGGYAVVQFLANAQDFGVPQSRKRHVLIASRAHTSNQLEALIHSIPQREHDIPVWDFISDLEFEPEDPLNLHTVKSSITAANQARINYLFETNFYNLPDRLRPPCHSTKRHSYVSMYGRLHAKLPAQTITSGFGSMGQGRFVHPTQRRMITAHEAARIQGFPDYFKFQPVDKLTSLRKVIGNAVPPPIAAGILLRLLFGMRNDRVPHT